MAADTYAVRPQPIYRQNAIQIRFQYSQARPSFLTFYSNKPIGF